MLFKPIGEQSVAWRRWALAGACFAAALALRLALAPWLGPRAPFLSFAPAVIVVAWLAGMWPGVAVALAGAVAGMWFLTAPGLEQSHSGDRTLLLSYLSTSFIGIWICELLHRSRRRTDQLARDQHEQAHRLEQELSERRRAEQSVRDMERAARRIIDANVIGVVITDLAGNIVEANDEFLRIAGQARAAVEAGLLNVMELTPPPHRHLDARAFDQLRMRGNHESYEKQFQRPDGTLVPVLVGAARLAGDAELAISYIADLTPQKQAEQVLREREQHYHALFETTPDGILICDDSGKYLEANQSFCQLLKLPREQVVGRSFADFIPPQRLHDAQQAFADLKKHGLWEADFPLRAADGSIVELEWRSRANFVPGLHFCMARDTSPHRRAEDALREAAGQLNSIIDASPIAIMALDSDGTVRLWNRAAERTFGWTAGEVLGQFLPAIPDEYRQQYLDNIRLTMEGAPISAMELRRRKKDGTEFTACLWTAPLRDADGRATGIISVVDDITARKRSETELAESERRTRLLTDALPALISYIDAELRYRFVNHAYSEWFGHDREEVVGRSVRDVLGPDAFALVEPDLRRALAGERVSYEKTLPYKDGPPRYVEAHYIPHVGEDGAVRGIYVMVHDLTGRRQVEEALKQSEQRFAAFMNHLPGPAWLKDLEGRYVYANPEAERVFGRRLNELLGRTDADLFPPETARTFHENDQRVIQAGQGIQAIELLRQPDNVEHSSVVSKFAVPGPDGFIAYVGGVAIDVTDRLAAERALRDSEQRYRFLAESIPQIVYTARPDGVVNYHNQRLLDYLGTTREQMASLGWIHFRHPDDRAEATRRWNRSIATGEPYDCMYRMLRGGDQTWRWHLARAVPMRDEGGEIVMWFGTCTDIDDQKRTEEALVHAKEAAEAAGKAKDQFLAQLSHELRTPLTPVVLAIDSMSRDPSIPAPLRDDLDMIRRNVGLEAKLIDDLLDLTRVTRGKLELRRERVDVHAALVHAVRSCTNAQSLPDGEKQVHIETELSAQRHHVQADSARLEQVFFNLLRNAMKFTPDGGSIRVRTLNEAHADSISIEVIDSGIGIEQDVLPRIFNAFEQGDRAVTRQFGGLGLGLAISRAIVELHGGSIRAHSDGRGCGATFCVELPVIAPAPHRSSGALTTTTTTPPPPPPMPPAAGGADGDAATTGEAERLRLLVVEDHAATANMMLRLLGHSRYDVKIARNVAGAQRLAEQNPFDLVVSDLGLPDGSGIELMRTLRERFGLRGIAISGYGMEEDLAQSKAAGFAEHLVKPITFEALEAAIRRVTAEKSVVGGQQA
jgi:PAS domain S-box-containing protein